MGTHKRYRECDGKCDYEWRCGEDNADDYKYNCEREGAMR